MSKFWSPIVATLKPYVAGEQPRIQNLIKLNTNENPYGPSPKAIAAMQAAVADSLKLYPDPGALALRQSIARFYGVEADEVFVGNGSDEVLAHAFVALLKHEQPLLYPDITYSFYPTYCRLFGIESVEIALRMISPSILRTTNAPQARSSCRTRMPPRASACRSPPSKSSSPSTRTSRW